MSNLYDLALEVRVQPLSQWWHDEVYRVLRNHIEAMAAAYFLTTDIPPDQAVLCQETIDGKMKFWFERRA